MMKKIKYCNILAYVMLIALILVVSPFVIPKIFGYEPYGILSNSMEPDYPVGSVVYVKAQSPESIEKGDVITFKTSVVSDSVATHRVMINDTKKRSFVTKGDHNDDVDATAVAYERLLGKVVLCVPKLGHVYLWLVSMFGVATCTFTLIMVITLWLHVAKWKKELDIHK